MSDQVLPAEEATRRRPRGRRDPSARPNRYIDIAYAAVALSAVSGEALTKSVPLYAPLVAVLAVLDRDLFRDMRRFGALLLPPLLIFLFIHVSFAFRVSHGNGLKIAASTAINLLFVTMLAARYSRVQARRFLFWSGVFTLVILLCVIAWHIEHHFYFSWKRLTNQKGIFDLLPALLVTTRLARTPLSKKIYVPLALFCTVAILFSGERKAYILMALFAPLLVDFRNPFTYITPAFAVAFWAGIEQFDKSGYVRRQVNTLLAFSQGKVVETSSNEGREAALAFAKRMFREHPLDGVGTNYVQFIFEQQTGVRLASHDEWMRVAAENGVIGLVFFAAAVAYGLVWAVLPQVWGRQRNPRERTVAFAIVMTLIMYISFEAYDFLVQLAFCLIPYVHFMKLDPREPGEAADPARERVRRRRLARGAGALAPAAATA